MTQANFAEQVREKMTELGINQKWLSEQSGVQQGSISRMLRGGNEIGTVKAWVSLAEALGCEWELRVSDDK